jgi:hypothetical protein
MLGRAAPCEPSQPITKSASMRAASPLCSNLTAGCVVAAPLTPTSSTPNSTWPPAF